MARPHLSGLWPRAMTKASSARASCRSSSGLMRGRRISERLALRPLLAEGGFRLREGHDLAVDPLLPDAPRDELRDLGAEVDDQDLVVVGVHGLSFR